MRKFAKLTTVIVVVALLCFGCAAKQLEVYHPPAKEAGSLWSSAKTKIKFEDWKGAWLDLHRALDVNRKLADDKDFLHDFKLVAEKVNVCRPCKRVRR